MLSTSAQTPKGYQPHSCGHDARHQLKVRGFVQPSCWTTLGRKGCRHRAFWCYTCSLTTCLTYFKTDHLFSMLMNQRRARTVELTDCRGASSDVMVVDTHRAQALLRLHLPQWEVGESSAKDMGRRPSDLVRSRWWKIEIRYREPRKMKVEIRGCGCQRESGVLVLVR